MENKRNFNMKYYEGICRDLKAVKRIDEDKTGTLKDLEHGADNLHTNGYDDGKRVEISICVHRLGANR